MSSIIEQAIACTSSAEILEMGSTEYLFHEAVTAGKLSELLAKFPRGNVVEEFVNEKVLTFEKLDTGWEITLLGEINTLIDLIPKYTLEHASEVIFAKADPATDEMFCLNGELNYVFQDAADRALSSNDRALLREFFYGVDFTHWTKWAILMNYTDLKIDLSTLLSARRNGVNIVLDGKVLKVEEKPTSEV